MIKLNAKASLLGLTSAIFLLSGASTTIAAEITYKHQLEIPMADGSSQLSYEVGNDYSGYATYREWAVVTVTDNKSFKVYHTTRRNRGVFHRSWDHPVKAMKICLSDGFDLSNCQVIQSDTAPIPEGRSIHDLSIEIMYSESDRDHRRRFSIPTEEKPE
jgi:hypothetical protein